METQELDLDDIQLILEALGEYDPEPGVELGDVISRMLTSSSREQAEKIAQDAHDKAQAIAQSKKESIILLQAKLIKLKSKLIAGSAADWMKSPKI